jgi:hypothetical protein
MTATVPVDVPCCLDQFRAFNFRNAICGNEPNLIAWKIFVSESFVWQKLK